MVETRIRIFWHIFRCEMAKYSLVMNRILARHCPAVMKLIWKLVSSAELNGSLVSCFFKEMCFMALESLFFISILDEYESSVKYCDRQRRLTPPVYNEARVNEKPVPNSNQPAIDDSFNVFGNSVEDDEQAAGDIFNSDADSIECSSTVEDTSARENSADDDEQAACSEIVSATEEGASTVGNVTDNNGQAAGFEEVLVNETDELNTMVKQEDPLELVNDIDDGNSELNELTSVQFEVVDEDLAMFYESKNSFKPKATSLVFKSDDAFSGSIPFKSYPK